MATYTPEPLFTTHSEHGEGPLWDAKKQKFIWVDILKGRFNEADWNSHKVESYKIGQALGVMGLESEGKHVMGVRDGFGLFNRGENRFELIEPSPERDNGEVRFNDGRVAPDGSFYAGTMEWEGKPGLGKLFRLHSDLSYTTVDTNLSIPNGMGWNREETYFFMIDTVDHCVYRFEYDKATGEITGKERFIQLAREDFPDGMAIDAEDCFWIAMWGGGRIDVFSPQGKKIDEVRLPVPYPTSCAFTGPGLDHLFITSSRLPLDEQAFRDHPLSGRCFILETKQKGKPDYRFKFGGEKLCRSPRAVDL